MLVALVLFNFLDFLLDWSLSKGFAFREWLFQAWDFAFCAIDFALIQNLRRLLFHLFHFYFLVLLVVIISSDTSILSPREACWLLSG